MQSSDRHRYFQAIEATFIRLRGAPLLLSPSDWKVAKEWFEAGIPLELVEAALELVFERRKEKTSKGKVQGLRYCRSAVEESWQERLSLTAAGKPTAAPELAIAPRLEKLAAALPEDIPQVEVWRQKILAMNLAPDQAERALAELDGELLSLLEESLSSKQREQLKESVARSLTGLAASLPAEELALSRDRLLRRAMRELLGVPILSLFSPDALEEEGSA